MLSKKSRIKLGKSYFIIGESLIFAPTNIWKMLKTLLLAFIIIVICVALLCVKVLLKKDGRFPDIHIEGNKDLAKKGIYCAKTEHRLQVQHKNLYDRLGKTN